MLDSVANYTQALTSYNIVQVNNTNKFVIKFWFYN